MNPVTSVSLVEFNSPMSTVVDVVKIRFRLSEDSFCDIETCMEFAENASTQLRNWKVGEEIDLREIKDPTFDVLSLQKRHFKVLAQYINKGKINFEGWDESDHFISFYFLIKFLGMNKELIEYCELIIAKFDKSGLEKLCLGITLKSDIIIQESIPHVLGKYLSKIGQESNQYLFNRLVVLKKGVEISGLSTVSRIEVEEYLPKDFAINPNDKRKWEDGKPQVEILYPLPKEIQELFPSAVEIFFAPIHFGEIIKENNDFFIKRRDKDCPIIDCNSKTLNEEVF